MMDRTFNKIVLSKTEPNVEDLWMRINIEKTDKGKFIHGHSLWWFTTQGWKKLFDFDTRYDVKTEYSYTASESPYDSKSEYNPKVGMVTVDNTYNLYDASRTIGDNANLVTEKGLKYHVDNLQRQIDALDRRVSKLESDLSTEIQTRELQVQTINSSLESLTDLVGELSSRLRTLEENV